MPKHLALLCGIGAALALTMLDRSEARGGDQKEALVDVEVRFANIANQQTLNWLNSLKDKSGDVCMTAKQVTEFVKSIQEDQRNNLMQIPKMTALSGHKAKFDLTEEFSYVKTLTVGGEGGKVTLKPSVDSIPLGVRFEVLPTVASNQKDVTLTLSAYMANLNGPVPVVPVTTLDADQKHVKNFIQLPSVAKIELTKTLTVPSGKSVLFLARRDSNERRDVLTTPVLGKIKYLERLFTQVAYSREINEMYIWVTPRIAVKQEIQKVIAVGN